MTDSLTGSDLAQEILTQGAIAEHLSRVARGEGFIPSTAEAKADAAAQSDALRDEVDEMVARLRDQAEAAVTAATDEDLADLVESLSEQLAEIASERFAFGDSAPGTGAWSLWAEALLDAAHRRFVANAPAAPVAPVPSDEPF